MDTFADRLDGGWKWLQAASEQAQEGRWVRDAVERQVIKDVGAATNPLHGGRLPPFTDEVGQCQHAGNTGSRNPVKHLLERTG
ncbi:hypothetical protein [Streptomyces sp. NBC_01006]|uniref:hypothetical protein n=1 Tax=Streptomyces sp. NBC_01006 TaxID=2903716 RepID=UPI002F910EBD|nr:hypothetical protein OG509_42665 [Streptomyces sp. NBC_01006]